MNLARGVQAAYGLVILLQIVWHVVLPPPYGNRSWVLGLIATLPLLLPVFGILAGRVRSMTWGAYLLVLYFVLGITEAWSSAPQRIVALSQVGLTLLYFTCLLQLVRHQAPQKDR